MEPIQESTVAKKLTKEEKKVLQKIKMEELKNQAMKDELTRELVITKKLKPQLTRRWLHIGREYGTNTMQDSLHDAWKTFELANDSKDATIKELTHRLENHKLINQKLYFDNAAFIEVMVQSYLEIADKMKEEANRHKIIYRKRSVDLTKLNDCNERQLDLSKYAIVANNNMAAERLNITLGEFITQKDEEVSKYKSELELWVQKTMKNTSRIWKEYKEITQSYKNFIEFMNTKSSELIKKVDMSSLTVRNQEKQIKYLTTKVDKYNDFINRYSVSSDNRLLMDLMEEHAEMYKKHEDVKRKHRNMLIEAKNRLSNLVHVCNNVINALEAAKSKVERINKLNQLCCKYETTSETNTKKYRIRNKWQFTETHAKMVTLSQKTFTRVDMIRKLMYADKKKLIEHNGLLSSQLKVLINSTNIKNLLDCARNNECDATKIFRI